MFEKYGGGGEKEVVRKDGIKKTGRERFNFERDCNDSRRTCGTRTVNVL